VLRKHGVTRECIIQFALVQRDMEEIHTNNVIDPNAEETLIVLLAELV
jgi:hypothetical protein